MLESESGIVDSEALQEAIMDIVEELIDDQCLGLSFEIHKSCRRGAFLLSETDPESAENFALVDLPGVDVLGQTPTKQNFDCQCPKCHRYQAASRFAPHLEKCMGMGRNSSRIANRRIANNTKRDSEESGGDDENDNDWSYGTEHKKVKRLKKDKGANSPRNKKAGRIKNGMSHGSTNGPHSSQESVESVPEATVLPNYEMMTYEERRDLLASTCGVISEHTKRMCTRTARCPQHTDEQRRQVRILLLRTNRQPAPEREDTLVDIDTCDDTEAQSLRESLQWEASSNSSPADSTSTNNSTTSSHKRPLKNSKHSGNSSSKSKKKSSSKPSSSSSSRDSACTSLYDFPS